MTKVFIVDMWTASNSVEDYHTYKVAHSIESAKNIAFKYMLDSFEDVGVDDYTREEFDRVKNDIWIDEEEQEFGVKIYPATEE